MRIRPTCIHMHVYADLMTRRKLKLVLLLRKNHLQDSKTNIVRTVLHEPNEIKTLAQSITANNFFLQNAMLVPSRLWPHGHPAAPWRTSPPPGCGPKCSRPRVSSVHPATPDHKQCQIATAKLTPDCNSTNTIFQVVYR